MLDHGVESAAVRMSGAVETAVEMPLADLLRAETASLHRQTESGRFQRMLFKGAVTAGEYGRYLGQLRHLHDCLETLLPRAAGHHSGVDRVVSACEPHRARLDEDLAFLLGTTPEPLPVTTQFCSRLAAVEADSPASLLGAHYVLEGSKNGGAILAGIVRRSLALPGALGTAYLDPYGTLQPERWRGYKDVLNGTRFSAGERDTMVALAKETFEFFCEMTDQLA